MTPEQRHKLECVADMRLDGECYDHSRGSKCEDGCVSSYEMEIDDAFQTVAAAVHTVREVLDMPAHGPSGRERDLAELLKGSTVTATDGMQGYARLVLATGTPVDRAVAYLSDTGSPQSASGRLLLRAAERALRMAGDL